MSDVILYDYWRSSASYRVRIALNMKNISYQSVQIDLPTKEHLSEVHIQQNPQGFVPALAIDGLMLTQSLSILEYLDETRSCTPFLPGNPIARQQVRAMAHVVAMDIHPVCNLNVASYVMELTNGGDKEKAAWMQRFILKGLVSLEELISDAGSGDFCFGDWPTLADICLIPQLYNAKRWGADFTQFKRIAAINAQCAELDSFKQADPDTVRGNLPSLPI